MRTFSIACVAFALISGIAAPAWISAEPPTVKTEFSQSVKEAVWSPGLSNVTATLENGLVTVTYDLDTSDGEACFIALEFSKDDGATYPYATPGARGDLGDNVATGAGKVITWRIGDDYPGECIPQARLRVVAQPCQATSLPVTTIEIPSGSFQMGDPWAEGGADERPVHTVNLDAYEIGKFEMTNAQVAKILQWAYDSGKIDSITSATIVSNGQVLMELSALYCQIAFSNGVFTTKVREGHDMNVHPSVDITWYGAVSVCNWLSEMEGKIPCYDLSTWARVHPMEGGYRLPTEAEWERAAAWDTADGGRHWRYGQSLDTISCADANVKLDTFCNPLGLSVYSYTTPVGWYNGLNPGTTDAKSPSGCYDMSGNVWEWMDDYGNSYFYPVSPVDNPCCDIVNQWQSLRGGSWEVATTFSRTSERCYNYRTIHFGNTGFRILRTIPATPDGKSSDAKSVPVTVESEALVIDTDTPVITLLGNAIESVDCGVAYTDAGASAADACSGADLSAEIAVVNTVDTNTPGVYLVHYTVSDAAGNAAAEVRRQVTVLSNCATEGEGSAEGEPWSPGLENVRISFSDGVVAIAYDLNTSDGSSCNISLELSKDDGLTYPFATPSAQGDLGDYIETGAGKTITWRVADDYPGECISLARLRLTAAPCQATSLPVTTIAVPSGNFMMGDPFGEGASHERPVHQVYLDTYEIGKYEMTNAQVAKIFQWAYDHGKIDSITAQSIFQNSQEILDIDSTYCQIAFANGIFSTKIRQGYRMDIHPATEISWHGAACLCNWLSEMEGKAPCYDLLTWARINPYGGGYRLPTEAEWERAAAWDTANGGRHWRYGQSRDTISCANANVKLDTFCNPFGLAAYGFTTPVGWYNGIHPGTEDGRSPVGCFDMCGNLLEWTDDYYSGTFYQTCPLNNPVCTVYCDRQSMRDGGWEVAAYRNTSSYRTLNYRYASGGNLGFRLARSVPATPDEKSILLAPVPVYFESGTLLFDTEPPVITLEGGASITVDCGGTYIAPIATAVDTCSEGNLSADIVRIGTVNTNLPGTYLVRYTVSDSAGNQALAVQTVIVIGNCTAEGEGAQEGEGQPVLVAVPDVAGMPQAGAETAIANLGLNAAVSGSECSDTVAAGSVIGTTPAAGTLVAHGAAVSLTLSSGSCGCAVPDVSYLDQQVAQATLANAGLALGAVTYEYSGVIADGFVFRQTPRAGASIVCGGAVNITISLGRLETPAQIIAGPYITRISSTSALVEWQTDIPATSGVYFDTTPALQYIAGATGYATLHSVVLRGLTPATAYFAQVFTGGESQTGFTESAVMTFRTLTAPDTTPPAILTGPAAHSISQDSAIIAWSTNEAADARVRYGTTLELSGTISSAVCTTMHNVILNMLGANTLYYVEVASADAAGNGPTYSRIFSFTTLAHTDVFPPVITAGPMVTAISDSQATIQWTTDEPSTSVVTYNNGAASQTVEDTALVREHTVYLTGLAPATEYVCQVASTDTLGNGPTTSAPFAFTTMTQSDATPPVIIEGPMVKNVTHQSAVIWWRTDEPADSLLEYGETPDLGASDARAALTCPHNMTLTGLKSRTTYYFRALSTDAQGNTVVSAVYTFETTGAQTCAAPLFTEMPTVDWMDTDRVLISWRTNELTDAVLSFGTNGYLNRRVTETEFAFEHQMILCNLKPGKTYQFRVLATNQCGESATSTIEGAKAEASFTTPAASDAAAPVLLEGPAVLYQAGTMAVVAWTTDEPATSYVQYTLSGDETLHTAGDLAFVTGHVMTLTNLTPGATCEFQVFSTDAAGNGPTASAKVQFQVTGVADATPPALVGTPEVTLLSADSARISWRTDEYATGQVRYGVLSGALENAAADAGLNLDHAVVLAALTPGSVYYYTLACMDAFGNAAESGVMQFEMQAAEGEGEGEGEGSVPGIHSADTNGDAKIQLSELLRVVQFFNMAGYSCDSDGVAADGYLPGPGDDYLCVRHASDYAEPWWQINLQELLRLVQFFNMGGYHACPEEVTSDGYCPGAAVVPK